jgi:hypothetical protein
MRSIKKVFVFARHFVVALSFVAGFAVGAIFGETVINRFAEPTVITYWLASL